MTEQFRTGRLRFVQVLKTQLAECSYSELERRIKSATLLDGWMLLATTTETCAVPLRGMERGE